MITRAKDVWEGWVGQQHVVRQINFYLDCYKKTGYMPNLGISSKRGNGKTKLAEVIGKAIAKPRIAINAATIRNAVDFVDSIVIPHCMGNNRVCLHFDEADAIHRVPSLETLLLSAIAPTKSHINIVDFQGQSIIFDNTRLNWIFSTTNFEKLGEPFRNRLKKIVFSEYNSNELGRILDLNLEDAKVEPETMKEIVSIARDTARTCVLLANDISAYCKLHNKKEFSKDDWVAFKKIMTIRPLGLDENEVNYLRLLSKHPSLTLTGISSALEYNTQMVRLGIEPFLVKKGLITIKQSCGRQITPTGKRILQLIDEKK